MVGYAIADAPAKKGDADSAEKDYSAELPRIPGTPPEKALDTFVVQPGFRIEQVAAEPLLADPTALAFDEFGRLYVNEMRGYSEDAEKNLGQVRLLEDTDGDGRFDKNTVFAEGFSWPTAVTCYDGGVFVGAAPDILYLKDEDGDGKADVKKVVFTGFGRGNVQGLLNTFKWGLDNRIHGATSSSGANVQSTSEPEGDPLALRGRDFAIEPRSLHIDATSGGGQHGLSFDRWGNKFVCSNSNHAQLVVYDDRYIARNPYLKAPSSRISIAADGPQAAVFRASPVEPWRIVRTRLRVQGIVKGPIEGGGTPAGYFTGSTGVTIYRGDAFPPEYQGNLFVADCGSNLVHRKVLEPRGVVQSARRADEKREFVASRDIWFRPVQMANGPDGVLYIADMSREVIEHPASIPPMIKKHVDLTSGRDRGRIYRVVPDGFKQPKIAWPGAADTAELVAMLEHTNGWHRETASRLIYERQDRAAIEPLERLARESKLPEGRMHAMYALAGLDALSAEVILARLDDEHPRVREHAVRLAENHAEDSPALRAKLYRIVADDDLRVRYQLAFSLGEIRERRAREALAELARANAGDSWMQLAVASSLGEGAGDVFGLLALDEAFRSSRHGRSFLESLAEQIGAQNKRGDVVALLKTLHDLSADETDVAKTIIAAVTRGDGGKNKDLAAQLAAATGGRAAGLLDELLASAAKTALDEKAAQAVRAEAVRSLSIGKFAAVRDTLIKLIDYRQPQAVQLAALATLGQFDDPSIAQIVIDAFPTLSPRLRNEALETLFARPAWIVSLLQSLGEGNFSPTDVDPARTRLLLAHPNGSIRRQAEKMLGAEKLSRRADVISNYRPALDLEGDASRGQQVFRKICAACHKLEGFGHEIGKDLLSIRNRGPETILVNVLDPNREVDPKYLNYVVITADGRSLSGVIAAETATSITLKRAENATNDILRIDIEALQSTGQSIMPEGLEKQIDQQAMADLVAYLMSLK